MAAFGHDGQRQQPVGEAFGRGNTLAGRRGPALFADGAAQRLCVRGFCVGANEAAIGAFALPSTGRTRWCLPAEEYTSYPSTEERRVGKACFEHCSSRRWPSL